MWGEARMQISDYKRYLPRLRTYYQRLGRVGRIALATIAVLAIGSIFFIKPFARKQQAAGQPQQPPAVPVTAAAVTLENVPLQVSAIGRTEPYSTVAITSQAEGQITRVNFTEGQ